MFARGAATLAFIFSSCFSAFGQQKAPDLLVTSRDHSLATVSAAVKSFGKVTGRERHSGLFYVTLRDGVGAEKAISRLDSGDKTKSSSLEFVLPASAVDVDPSDAKSANYHAQYLRAVGAYTGKEQGDYYDALAYYLSDRVGRDGKFHPEYYIRAQSMVPSMIQAPASLFGLAGAQPNTLSGGWQYLGPNNRGVAYQIYNGIPPVSGRVSGIAVDPTNANIIWVATSAGGVWKSLDGGVSWSPKSDSWQTMETSSIVIDPKNTNTVYVGTGDFHGRLGYGFGIMKTTDGGVHWKNYGTEWGNNIVSKLILDPDNSNILLATTNGFVWRSTDAGVTWSVVKDSKGNNVPPALWSGASVGVKPPAGGNRIFWIVGDIQFQNVWKSTDEGATWKPTSMPTLISTQKHRLDIAASQRSTGLGPTTVYVLNTVEEAVWRSKDGGVTWTGIGSGIPQDTDKGASVNWGQRDYDYYIATIPNPLTLGDCLFVGLVTVSSCNNAEGSADWTDFTEGDHGSAKMHTDQHCFLQDPTNPTRLYLGCDGGIFRCSYDFSSNSGTFTALNGQLGNSTFYSLAVHPTNSLWLLGGTQDTGTALANGQTFLWLAPTGGDGGVSLINPFSPGIEFSSSQQGDLYRTDNGWGSFSKESSGGGDNNYPNFNGETCAFIVPMALGKFGYPLYAGTDELWSYHNGSWTPDLGNKLLTTTDVIRAIATCPTNSQVLYTGSGDGELWKSANGGSSWNRLKIFYTGVTAICPSPNTSADVLVTTNKFGEGHVFHCTDTINGPPFYFNEADGKGGVSPLPDVPAHAIVRDPNDPNNTWYVGNDLGVFMTTNAGATWMNMGTNYGLPNVIVQDLQISPTGYLYAATFGRGIWRIKNVDLNLNGVLVDPSVVGGNVAHGTVTLSGYAGSQGYLVALTSNNPAAASVIPNVTVPGGQSVLPFTIFTNPVLVNTDVVITASHGGGLTFSKDIIVKPPSAHKVILSPNNIIGGYQTTGTVVLDGPAPITRQVGLSSSSALAFVPPAVSIPTGQKGANFPITSWPVASTTNVTISATLGVTKSATLTLTPGGLVDITFKPNLFVGGATRFGFVDLTGVVTQNTVVQLSGGNGVITPPSSVTVLTGTKQGVWSQNTPVVATTKQFTLTASLGDISKSVTITLVPDSLSVSLSPSTVTGGGFGGLTTGKVTLGFYAPATGVTVNLSSGSPAAAVAPTVTIPATTNSANFVVGTSPVSALTTAVISASLPGGVARTATLTIKPPLISSVTFSSPTVTGGNATTCYVSLTGPAPAAGMRVYLGTSDSVRAPVPASVFFPSGATSESFAIQTPQVYITAQATISASLGLRGTTVTGVLTITPIR